MSSPWRRVAAVSILAIACSTPAAVQTPAPQRPAPAPVTIEAPASAPAVRPRADVPAPRTATRAELSSAQWQERHAAQSALAGRGAARLLVLGDGVADGWASSRSFRKQWQKERPLSLALPGEQTQELLWRIADGALEGLAPRLTILLIGAENLRAGFTPAETAAGVRAVLEQVRTHLPASPVLLVAPPPAGRLASDPLRAQLAALGTHLAELAEPDHVAVADVGDMFIEADGSISPEVMSDARHPTELGYHALTTAVSLLAHQLLQNAGGR